MDTRTDQSASAQMHALSSRHQQHPSISAAGSSSSSSSSSSGANNGSSTSTVTAASISNSAGSSDGSQRERASSSKADGSNEMRLADSATTDDQSTDPLMRASVPMVRHMDGIPEPLCGRDRAITSAVDLAASFVAGGSSLSLVPSASAEPRLPHQFIHHSPAPRSLHESQQTSDASVSTAMSRSPRVHASSAASASSSSLLPCGRLMEETPCAESSRSLDMEDGPTSHATSTGTHGHAALLSSDIGDARNQRRPRRRKQAPSFVGPSSSLYTPATSRRVCVSPVASPLSPRNVNDQLTEDLEVTRAEGDENQCGLHITPSGSSRVSNFLRSKDMGTRLRANQASDAQSSAMQDFKSHSTGAAAPIGSALSCHSDYPSSFPLAAQSQERRLGSDELDDQTDTDVAGRNRFVSPNILLHRRAFGKAIARREASNVLARRRERDTQPRQDTTGSVFASAHELPTLAEVRRSSLGIIPTAPPQVSAPISIAQETFKLQPVPLERRKRPFARSKGKEEALWASVPVKRQRRAARHRFSPCIQAEPIEHLQEIPPTDRLTGISKSNCPSASLTTCQSIDAATIAERASAVRAIEGSIQTATSSSPLKANRSGVARPRLARSQSVPVLKAKPMLDITLPAVHRLSLPTRFVEYLAMLRETAERQQAHSRIEQHTSRPAAFRDRAHRQATASTPVSAFARNGYCSTTISADGTVKSIFVPSLHPPITRQTLKELDLHEILKNPQLRHDIVFDSNVQFRPNFDGERGRKKKEFGNKYWFAIQKEIETGCTCTSFSAKTLLPCACGLDKGREAATSFAASPASMKARPSGQPTRLALSARAPNFAAGSVIPPSAGVSRSAQIPSRFPLLVHELRAICLSVLPSPPGEAPTGQVSPNRLPSSAIGPSSPSSAKTMMQATATALAANRPSTSASGWSVSTVATHQLLIAQALDPQLITQQLQHGVLDVAGLITFLGSILKLHCAPMRDDLIEKMIKTVCKDGEVALGLRLCFEILELMKLDIANHQLRSSRLYLVETAVDFEMRWFREQLDHRKITLDRTSHWMRAALQDQRRSSSPTSGPSRSETIIKAFDQGLLDLIFEQPVLPTGDRLAVRSALKSNASVNGDGPLSPGGTTISSAALNYAFTPNYPETFQFDAYRLMSFHGDVTDITIVYMLLLLFRQLACSTSNLSQTPLPSGALGPSAVLENASGIASRRLASIKSEIWTLLNDADLEVANAGATSSLPPKTPSTPGLTGRLMGQGFFSSVQKLENPVWRKAMNDVVLQIAARAIEVQIQARQESGRVASVDTPRLGDSSLPQIPPPSEETVKLLVSWMETNLRGTSALHKLCQKRLKTILGVSIDDSKAKATPTRMVRKSPEDSEGGRFPSSGKRLRLEDGSFSSPVQSTAETPCTTSDDTGMTTSKPVCDLAQAVSKAGLEPFFAEIKLLSERILKVKTFHLRVFRFLYEKMAADLDARS